MLNDRLQSIRDRLHQLIYEREVTCFSEYESTLKDALTYMENLLDTPVESREERRYKVTATIHGMFNGKDPEEASNALQDFLWKSGVKLHITNVYALETTQSLMRRHPNLIETTDRKNSPHEGSEG